MGAYRTRGVLLGAVAVLTGCLNRAELADSGIMLAGENQLAGVEVTLQVQDRFGQANDIFLAGEEMVFSYKVVNTTQSVLEYELTYPGYDLVVTQSERRIWSPFDGVFFPQVSSSGHLAAGEVLDFTVRWNGINHQDKLIEPGQYQIQPYLSLFVDGVKVDAPEEKVFWVN